MDCVNHSGVPATAYCQSCGKALCANCVRNGPGGQILCEPCMAAWQAYQQPFVAPVTPGAPNPAAAAVLGLIPGVGAMYNGQFFKGLIHVVIFAVLISITDHYPIFGLFIAAWVLYQSFEAYHTARARRDGEPLPDPLGLNELGGWLNLGGRQQNWGQPGPTPGQGPVGGQGSVSSGPMNPGPMNPGPINSGPINSGPINPGAAGANPASTSWQSPYTGQAPYGSPYAPPGGGFVDPGVPPIPPIPPVPPVPPMYWRRKEPIGAIVLIALGVLFLLGQLDILRDRVFEFAWPLMLIGLGVWLVIRRTGYGQGGPK
jgi:TM2 domain-containing membrane protein YozV